MLIMRLYKKISKGNTFIMPKKVLEKFGMEYFLEVYEDKIIIVPAKENEK